MLLVISLQYFYKKFWVAWFGNCCQLSDTSIRNSVACSSIYDIELPKLWQFKFELLKLWQFKIELLKLRQFKIELPKLWQLSIGSNCWNFGNSKSNCLNFGNSNLNCRNFGNSSSSYIANQKNIIGPIWIAKILANLNSNRIAETLATQNWIAETLAIQIRHI